MPAIVHIDIAADDPERAARFYQDVFDWKVTKLEGPVSYWLLSPGGEGGAAVGGGIAKREQAWQSVTPTIEVPSADAYGERIVRAGGTIVVAKVAIEGVGHLLTFKDPEGNVLAILEPAPGNPFAPPAPA